MIQNKDYEISSLSDKHQSGNEPISIMKQRVSELQEEKYLCQNNLEREISFIKNQQRRVIVQLK